MMRKAVLVYDLNDPGVERACIATRNAVTAQPCPHGETWQCRHAIERYVFETVSPMEADLMGNAIPDEPPKDPSP
jgi:hypothetical protein